MYGNNPRAQLKALRSDVARLRGDVRKLGGTAADRAEERLSGARDGVADRIHARSDALRQRARDVQTRGAHVKHEAEAGVGRHPYSTILAAAGLGFVTATVLQFVARRARARRQRDAQRLPEQSRPGRVIDPVDGSQATSWSSYPGTSGRETPR